MKVGFRSITTGWGHPRMAPKSKLYCQDQPKSVGISAASRIRGLRISPPFVSAAKLVTDMDTQAHWERVYGTKAPTELSWFRPHLETSLALIKRVADERSASIIDVGGGESTLVDDLIACGYRNVTVIA